MLRIVTGHWLQHGGILETVTGTASLNYYVSKTIYAFLLVHVNYFVLVSGYFLCEGIFKVKISYIVGKCVFLVDCIVCNIMVV